MVSNCGGGVSVGKGDVNGVGEVVGWSPPPTGITTTAHPTILINKKRRHDASGVNEGNKSIGYKGHEMCNLMDFKESFSDTDVVVAVEALLIITAAAASRFHHRGSEQSVEYVNLISVKAPPPLEFASIPTPTEISTVMEEHPTTVESALVYESENAVVEVKNVVVNDYEIMENNNVVEDEDEDEFITSNLRWWCRRWLLQVESRL
ncbi:Hypothetical predicted protein [Olea europaea subsp. europaea]|uniref:Uncharacterized protein n=1 Tax=Olea europaea subsp. europaea TaxID=158383 RepID=A0A8S0TP54_OLEEU|nr:Hypothetical predicted protein [Olea europaea subsp. europaea]